MSPGFKSFNSPRKPTSRDVSGSGRPRSPQTKGWWCVPGPRSLCLLPLPWHQQGLTPPTLVPGKQVTTPEAASMPVDQDVEQEAKTVETYLEKLRVENPLVLREMTKESQTRLKKQRPLLRGPFGRKQPPGGSRHAGGDSWRHTGREVRPQSARSRS